MQTTAVPLKKAREENKHRNSATGVVESVLVKLTYCPGGGRRVAIWFFRKSKAEEVREVKEVQRAEKFWPCKKDKTIERECIGIFHSS
jgi:hypothetical protein